MSVEDWRDRWEREAEAAYRGYLERPGEALVEDVRAGRWDGSHQLWRAVAAKASLREAGRPLMGVVRSGAPYLVRYHASAALLKLLDSNRFVAADLAVESPRRLEWLDVVERILDERLGPAGEHGPAPAPGAAGDR